MHTKSLMNRVGAPDNIWYLCSLYLAQVHNVTSKESLKWKTPLEKCHGYTQDISAYLLFEFYKKIYHLDSEEKYPHIKEQKRRFMGVAENIGDALTFTILTAENKILTRSVIRYAVNPTRFGYENKCLLSQEESQQLQAQEQAQEDLNTSKYYPPTSPLDNLYVPPSVINLRGGLPMFLVTMKTGELNLEDPLESIQMNNHHHRHFRQRHLPLLIRTRIS